MADAHQEPLAVPSWLLWKLIIPVFSVILAGGVSFVAWATPKIITAEGAMAQTIKLQDEIRSDLKQIHQDLKEIRKELRKP